jgi:flagellar biosynthesis protein FlhG
MIGQAERVLELQRLKNKTTHKRNAKIAAFSSGKGGTGKTFAIVNMAVSIARAGAKTLLIDLDTNLSNINILLDYHPEVTSFEFLQKRKLFEEIIVNYSENLDIIFGDSGKAEYPEFDEKFASDFIAGLDKVADRYDYILIDTASGAGAGLIALLAKVDFNIIVTTPEPTAVMDAYVLAKLLKVNGGAGKKLVIFNKCLNNEAGNTGYNNLQNACSHFLGENIELLGSISYDQEVMKSIMEQKLLIIEAPGCAPAAQIEMIGRKFLKYAQVANIGHVSAGF